MKTYLAGVVIGVLMSAIWADDKTGLITTIVTKSSVAPSGAGEVHIYVDDDVWYGRILPTDIQGKNLLALCLSAQAQTRKIRIITEGTGAANLVQQIILK